MEIGLDDIWDDGICCTGLLVDGDPESVGRLFGHCTELVKDQAVVINRRADPIAYAMRPSASAWTIVEFHQRLVDRAVETGQDYLIPLFEQAIGAIEGIPPEVDTFIYETPVSAAAFISREQKVPAIAIWGSDEHPGLSGGAFFSTEGNLELVCSAHNLEAIQRWFGERTAAREELDEATEEDLPDDAESTYVYVGSADPAIKKVSIADYLDKEFRIRGAAFDGADLLQDLYRAILERNPGDEFLEVDAFYLVEK